MATASQRAGYVSGLLTCVAMLADMDMDECTIAGVSVLSARRGRPQDNAVRRNIDEILRRGDLDELEGFCAALTDIVASADDSGDYYRMFGALAEEQLRVRS